VPETDVVMPVVEKPILLPLAVIRKANHNKADYGKADYSKADYGISQFCMTIAIFDRSTYGD
jgi:hypothetical protein